MKSKVNISLPKLWLIAATRGMLGAGIGLLVGEKLSHKKRHTIGTTLLAVGLASTVPLAIDLFRQK